MMGLTRRNLVKAGGGLVAGAAFGTFGGFMTRRAAKTVLVICIDCMRADQCGFHGCDEPTTPALDALAEGAVVFENAYTNGNWTKPAVASFFTGLRVAEHGVDKSVEPGGPPGEGMALPPGAGTLAGVFARAGYSTAAVLHQPHLVSDLGFAEGFDHYDQGGYSAERIEGRFARWLAGRERGESVFAYLHFLDCHGPFVRTKEYAEVFGRIDLGVAIEENWREPGAWRRFREEVNSASRAVPPDLAAHFLNLYRGRARKVDDAVARVFGMLAKAGRFDEALIAVFADHGENFLEHGALGHRPEHFYQQQLRIPLVIKFPRSLSIAPRRVKAEVETIDLSATLAAAAGGRLGSGRDLAAAAKGAVLPRRFITTESDAGMTVIRDGLKAHVSTEGAAPKVTKVVDVRRDEAEASDVCALHPRFVAEVNEFLPRWRERAEEKRLALGKPFGMGALSRENVEALRALGYIQ